MSKSTIMRLALVCILLAAGLLVAHNAVAHEEKPTCDLQEVINHQAEHAQDLVNFADEAQTNPNAAFANLYRTGIAYQALALECGFADGLAVESAHELEHSGLFDTEDTHNHSEGEEAAVLALAQSIGDPENGKILFNTVRTEVSFACATCHRVDSTETLIGPGLLGISGHSHNHSETPVNGTTDSMSGMNMGEATAAPEQTFEQKVDILRTSITNPSASVMTGFPDNLMPKVYGTIFSEQDINDLIAYLYTLD